VPANERSPGGLKSASLFALILIYEKQMKEKPHACERARFETLNRVVALEITTVTWYTNC